MHSIRKERLNLHPPTDFEIALENLRVYATVILDENNKLSDETTQRLWNRRYFTPHFKEIYDIVIDYYGINNSLSQPKLCTITALDKKLNTSFRDKAFNSEALTLKKIMDVIKLTAIRDQLQQLEQPLNYFSKELRSLVEQYYKVINEKMPSVPLTEEALMTITKKINLSIQEPNINLENQLTVIQQVCRFPQHPRFFSKKVYSHDTKSEFTFSLCFESTLPMNVSNLHG